MIISRVSTNPLFIECHGLSISLVGKAAVKAVLSPAYAKLKNAPKVTNEQAALTMMKVRYQGPSPLSSLLAATWKSAFSTAWTNALVVEPIPNSSARHPKLPHNITWGYVRLKL